jgi:hypothetical protein
MDERVRRGMLGAVENGAVGVWFDGPSPHVHRVPGYPPELALIDLWYTSGEPWSSRGEEIAVLATVGVADQPALA